MKESVQSPSRLQSRITTAVQSPAKIRAQCRTARRALRTPNRKSDIRRESRIPPCGSGNTPYAAISPADRRKADKPKSTCIRKCFLVINGQNSAISNYRYIICPHLSAYTHCKDVDHHPFHHALIRRIRRYKPHFHIHNNSTFR